MYVINEKTKIVNIWADTDINRQRLASGKYGVVEYNGEIETVDNTIYAKGYAPVKPQEVKEQEVRAVREQYFADYVDFYQSKPLLWEEMTDEEKQDIADYRKYLMDYTKQEDWWEKNPLDFEEWKEKKDEEFNNNSTR